MSRAKTFGIFLYKFKTKIFPLQGDKERVLTEEAWGATGFIWADKDQVCTQRMKITKTKLSIKIAKTYTESNTQNVNVTKQ